MPFSEACFKLFGTNLSSKYERREALEYIHTYVYCNSQLGLFAFRKLFGSAFLSKANNDKVSRVCRLCSTEAAIGSHCFLVVSRT